jgi:hypothetical protein
MPRGHRGSRSLTIKSSIGDCDTISDCDLFSQFHHVSHSHSEPLRPQCLHDLLPFHQFPPRSHRGGMTRTLGTAASTTSGGLGEHWEIERVLEDRGNTGGSEKSARAKEPAAMGQSAICGGRRLCRREDGSRLVALSVSKSRSLIAVRLSNFPAAIAWVKGPQKRIPMKNYIEDIFCLEIQ